MLRIQFVNRWDGVERLAEHWNRLAGAVPFRKWQWLAPWWNEYQGGRDLFVLAVYGAGDELVGIAPWYAQDCVAQGRVVRFWGTGEACSEYLSLLAKPGSERLVGQAVGRWLVSSESAHAESAHASSPSARWDLIELANVACDDPGLDGLHETMADAGCTVHQRPGVTCWRIELPDTWQQYLAGLSRPNRRRVRTCHERLQQADAVRHTASTPAELALGWRVLVDLHQQRWNSLGQEGCFAKGAFERFLLRAAEQLLAEGSLRLSWIELGGRAVAGLIAFQDNGLTYAYQSGIAADCLHENPGWLVQSAAIRDAIESGCRGFDLLRGNEPYKGHLGAQPREMADMRIVSRRLAPQLRHTAWVTGNFVKKTIKSGLLAAQKP